MTVPAVAPGVCAGGLSVPPSSSVSGCGVYGSPPKCVRLLNAGPTAGLVFEHVACCRSQPGYTVKLSPIDGCTGNGKPIAKAPGFVNEFTGPETPAFAPEVKVSCPSLK